MFCGLNVSHNLHSPSSSAFIALNLLVKTLSSSQLIDIILIRCQLTSRHAYHLFLLITQARNLKKLRIGDNQLQESVPLLVSAAKNLTSLELTKSGIGDKELLEVGLILQSNTNMMVLEITSHAAYTETMDSIKFETVSRFIEMIVAPDSQSCLKQLVIADCYLESLKCDKIQNTLKRFTSRRGFPLEITSPMRMEEGKNVMNVFRAAASLPSALLYGKT